jgi:hypothetical protein
VWLNGERIEIATPSGTILRLSRTRRSGDVLTLELPVEVSADYRYKGAAVIERGPLVYVLRMNEKREKKSFAPEQKAHCGEWYCEVTQDTPRNYCLTGGNPRPDAIAGHFTVEKIPVPLCIPGPPQMHRPSSRRRQNDCPNGNCSEVRQVPSPALCKISRQWGRRRRSN